MRHRSVVFIGLLLTVSASRLIAGPWGGIPDAVARLQKDPADQSAQAVLAEAEASVLHEAANGRLAAVAVLMETYTSLVMQLDDGAGRVRRLERRTATALATWGDGRSDSDPESAATAWTLAGRYDDASPAFQQLRRLFLPPDDPEAGQKWRSPLDGAELVYQPAERIRVGCSETDRRCRDNEIFFRWVDVPGFWIEATEVSNARYRQCVDAGYCSLPQGGYGFGEPGSEQLPVVGVNWHQAREFARWVGRRLPSEAEWERAARGKDTRWRYPWGNARRADLANVWEGNVAVGRGSLPVGTFPATGWGLFDMPGNVWEWCSDRYQVGFKELPADGSPMRSGIGRVVRGGSWRRDIDLARVSARSWFDEDFLADDLGFRCAVSRSSEISNARLLSAAERVFPSRSTSGNELAGVRLSAEDRRYLERRAVTWLMLEKRGAEAALQVELLLRRDPRDSVALDVLEWIEGELVDAALAGDVDSVEVLRSRYLRAVSSSARFERRLRETEARLGEALRECGGSMARGGDRARARACFDLGLRVSPGDPVLRRGLESLRPAAGDSRISPKDGRVMVWIPPGSYRIGATEGDRQAALDEFPAGIRVVRGFWIDRSEVTNADYRRCVDAGDCSPPTRTEAFDDPNRESYPVLWVTWYQARDFAKWAGKRLPSEAEWERAARAGSETRFPWGDRWEDGRGNALDASGADRWGAEAPVDSFPANAWGVHDLIGNAAEWVQDVYHSILAGGPVDGSPWERETGPAAERRRVVRGGSYNDPPSRQRVSRRSGRKPTDSHRSTGFRCAAD